jgi:tRNA(Ile2) C34 agmatinyltransferase TiaS
MAPTDPPRMPIYDAVISWLGRFFKPRCPECGPLIKGGMPRCRECEEVAAMPSAGDMPPDLAHGRYGQDSKSVGGA